MKFTMKKLYHRIYRILFYTQYDMNMSLLRIAEFNNNKSSKIWSNYFSFEDIFHHLTKKNNGIFDYANQWSGFALEGKGFLKWNCIFRANLRVMELDLCTNIMNLGAPEVERSSFIMTYRHKDSHKVIKHELAHAMYETCPAYKKEMNGLIREMMHRDRKAMEASLGSHGYSIDLYKDEIQAYLATPECDDMELFNIDTKEFKKAYNKYREALKNG